MSAHSNSRHTAGQEAMQHSGRLEEPWASLVALAACRLEAGAYEQARAAFAELGGLRPDLCEAWAGASVAAHLQGDREAARTFQNMLEASCPPRDLLGWVQTMITTGLG